MIQKPKGLQHRNKENQLVPICIAEDQNTLEYFSIYGYSNCYTNCRVKAMLRYCGCLPFIFNNVAEYNKIKVMEILSLNIDKSQYSRNHKLGRSIFSIVNWIVYTVFRETKESESWRIFRAKMFLVPVEHRALTWTTMDSLTR